VTIQYVVRPSSEHPPGIDGTSQSTPITANPPDADTLDAMGFTAQLELAMRMSLSGATDTTQTGPAAAAEPDLNRGPTDPVQAPTVPAQAPAEAPANMVAWAISGVVVQGALIENADSSMQARAVNATLYEREVPVVLDASRLEEASQQSVPAVPKPQGATHSARATPPARQRRAAPPTRSVDNEDPWVVAAEVLSSGLSNGGAASSLEDDPFAIAAMPSRMYSVVDESPPAPVVSDEGTDAESAADGDATPSGPVVSDEGIDAESAADGDAMPLGPVVSDEGTDAESAADGDATPLGPVVSDEGIDAESAADGDAMTLGPVVSAEGIDAESAADGDATPLGPVVSDVEGTSSPPGIHSGFGSIPGRLQAWGAADGDVMTSGGVVFQECGVGEGDIMIPSGGAVSNEVLEVVDVSEHLRVLQDLSRAINIVDDTVTLQAVSGTFGSGETADSQTPHLSVTP